LSGPKDSANSPTVIHRDVSGMRFPFSVGAVVARTETEYTE